MFVASVAHDVSDGEVDLLARIKELRNDRVALVQHGNQYELVYQACLDFAERCDKDVDIFDPEDPAHQLVRNPTAYVCATFHFCSIQSSESRSNLCRQRPRRRHTHLAIIPRLMRRPSQRRPQRSRKRFHGIFALQRCLISVQEEVDQYEEGEGPRDCLFMHLSDKS